MQHVGARGRLRRVRQRRREPVRRQRHGLRARQRGNILPCLVRSKVDDLESRCRPQRVDRPHHHRRWTRGAALIAATLQGVLDLQLELRSKTFEANDLISGHGGRDERVGELCDLGAPIALPGGVVGMAERVRSVRPQIAVPDRADGTRQGLAGSGSASQPASSGRPARSHRRACNTHMPRREEPYRQSTTEQTMFGRHRRHRGSVEATNCSRSGRPACCHR